MQPTETVEGAPEASPDEPRWKAKRGKGPPPGTAPMGAVYGLGFIGALVHYIQAAETFGAGLLGVLKAFVWPAFFVYHLLRHVGA